MDTLDQFLDRLSQIGHKHPEIAVFIGSILLILIFGFFYFWDEAMDAKRQREHEAWLRRQLTGIRAGVWIREPNNSAHIFQNVLEQKLVEHGMVMFDLRREHAKSLVEHGEWNPEFSTSILDVAIVGRIIPKSTKEEITRHVTKRHYDTATGLRFDSLPKDHPNYRSLNAYKNKDGEILFDSKHSKRFNIYVEPNTDFEFRLEREAITEEVTVNNLSVDLRFYGPLGQIHGGHANTLRLNGKEEDVLSQLADETLEKLANAVKPSLIAHMGSVSEAELDGGRARALPPIS